MPQFGRPSADIVTGVWEEDDGTTASLFDQIDEVSPDDADYIRSPGAPSSAVYVTKLSALTDPQASAGHVVRYRYRKDQEQGDAIDLTVELREGYASEGSQGTLVASNTHTNIPGDGWVSGAFTLTQGQADSITNYADLYLRFVANTA